MKNHIYLFALWLFASTVQSAPFQNDWVQELQPEIQALKSHLKGLSLGVVGMMLAPQLEYNPSARHELLILLKVKQQQHPKHFEKFERVMKRLRGNQVTFSCEMKGQWSGNRCHSFFIPNDRELRKILKNPVSVLDGVPYLQPHAEKIIASSDMNYRPISKYQAKEQIKKRMPPKDWRLLDNELSLWRDPRSGDWLLLDKKLMALVPDSQNYPLGFPTVRME